MNIQIHIRQALVTEQDAVCALISELDEYHRRARPDIFRKPSGATRERHAIEALIAGPDSAILVAVLPDDSLIGLVILLVKSVPASAVRDERRFVEIDALIVRAGMRRHGVAKSLITASKAWADSLKIHHFEVSAWSFNIGAIAAYKKIGFQPVVERFAISFEDEATPDMKRASLATVPFPKP